jgi:hypothetical protein
VGILPHDNGSPAPPQSSYSPQQIWSAYGISSIMFGNIKGDGMGQTIAIVDAYDNPAFLDTSDPNFDSSDLHQFDKQFQLPDPPSFRKVGQDGSSTLPPTDPRGPGTNNWELEEALDVEWAHAIAPKANIVLVETNFSFTDGATALQDLLAGVTTAAGLPGVSVVSTSWGFGEFRGETPLDSTFAAPGVTFVTSTGDNGAPGEYPAFSPNEVAVGGTTLILNPDKSYNGEAGWFGSGGGISRYEPEPSYQKAIQNTGRRTIPDVSFDADPATGVAIYDSYNDVDKSGPWVQVGGTSLSAPSWAGLIAIANQGRVLAGGTPLTGNSQTLPALYSLPSADFHDVTEGFNFGFMAKPGYDEVTGIGTPIANLLVPDLAAYGIATEGAVTTQPPPNVIAGDSFAVAAAAVDSHGNVDTSVGGTATLSRIANPGGDSFSPVMVPVTQGVAVFDDLTLNQIDNGYQFQITISGFAPVTTSTFNIITDPTPGSGTFYPAPTDSSLRAAIAQADSNGNTSNTIVLSNGIYALTNTALGQLVISNTSNLPGKTLTIGGLGPGITTIEPDPSITWSDRIVEIMNTPGKSVTVNIQELTIAGGRATDGGAIGGSDALGGGILIDGTVVSLTKVSVARNAAVGALGASGSAGQPGTVAGAGGPGGTARGGGIYLASGSLKLVDTLISGNLALGGAGGSGGTAGAATPSNVAGTGGAGGSGASGLGGGAYVASGTVTGSSDTFQSNAASGGAGGSGGFGGTRSIHQPGGPGGSGGTGGPGIGGAIFLDQGTLTLSASTLQQDTARGGIGGAGGPVFRTGTSTTSPPSSPSGSSPPSGVHAGRQGLVNPATSVTFGQNGSGGFAAGGGLFVSNGTVTLTGDTFTKDRASGGATTTLGATSSNSSSGGGSGSLARRAGSRLHPSAPASRVQRNLGGADPHDDKAPLRGWYEPFRHNASGSGSGSGTSTSGTGPNPGSAVGGSIYVSKGSVSITGNRIEHNRASTAGGGIANAGNVAVTSSTIANNSASEGGGIANAGTMTVHSSKLSANSAAYGGAVINFSRLSIANSTMDRNSASQGGAIYNDSGGTVQLSHVSLQSNVASFGGAIFNQQGALTIGDSTLKSDHAMNAGGAIYNRSKLSMTDSTLDSNGAHSGGGLYNATGGAVTIQHVKLAYNSSFYGGGIFSKQGSLTIANSTIASNSAEGTVTTVTSGRGRTHRHPHAVGNGGAIDEIGGSIQITGSTVDNNTSREGGGLYVGSGTLTIAGSTLSGNTATDHGGAVDNSGTLTISTSTFEKNNAVYGGGIDTSNPGPVNISSSTLDHNTATSQGGAVLNFNTTVSITDCTLNNNSATNQGGGIFNYEGTLTLTNSTLAANSSTNGGGIFSEATLTAINCTIAGNMVTSGGSGGGVNVAAGTASLYNTIVALNTNGGLSDDLAGSLSASSVFNLIGVVNPGLGPLAYNGGPTQTMALLLGSTALDSGCAAIAGVTVPVTDQRGALRGPAGLNAGPTVDVGAYEATSSYLVAIASDSLDIGTLRAAISWADVSTNANPQNVANPAANTVVFDTKGTFASPQTITLSPARGTLGLSNRATAVAIDGPGADVVTISGGDAVAVFGIDPGVTAALSGLKISGGSAAEGGGGIANFGTLSVTDSILSHNSASFGGAINNAGRLTLSDSTLSDNSAVRTTSTSGIGGAIYDSSRGAVTISDTMLSGNSATSGAGVFVFEGALTISNSKIEANTAANQGGAIFNSGGTVDVIFSTISGNMAGSGGGTFNAGSLAITASTLNTNSATGQGGAIFGDQGSLTLTNTTVSGNSATCGGGIFTKAMLTAINSTIAGNNVSAAGSGGGLDIAGSAASLYNTIVALNTVGTGSGAPADDIAGAVSPQSSYNLIGTGGSGGLTNGIQGNKVGVASPGLGPLANNGGRNSTMALLAGSPAIDAGSASITGVAIPATDQRGALRGPAGLDAGTTVDVGAYEASSSFLVSSTADSGDAGTLRTAVAWANLSTNANAASLADPGPNTIVFDTSGLFSSPQTITLTLGPLVLSNRQTPIGIEGPGAALLSIAGGDPSPVFQVNSGVTASLTGLTVSGGRAASGGGIGNAGILTIASVTVAGNSASESGAGIDNTGTMTIVDSTISGNSTAGNGGGIANESGATLTLTNVTISGNQAANGGGIFSAGILTAINCTIAGNAVATNGSGGGLSAASGPATLDNTIVALNTAGSASPSDIAGTLSPASTNNLIGTGGSGGLTGAGGNIVGVSDPGLGPLGSNGGPTETMALLSGSPAMDGGRAAISGVTVPVTDQRGALRGPVGLDAGPAVDIGAFEASSSYLVTTSTDLFDVGTLRSAVGWANVSSNTNPQNLARPASNTVMFDTQGAFASPQTITLAPALGTLELSNTKTPEVIKGPVADALTISGDLAIGVFLVDHGVTATLSGLTISGGSASQGGGIDNAGMLTIRYSAISSNSAAGNGGGIDNSGTLTIVGSTIDNNTATSGGGIANEAGATLLATNAKIARNTTGGSVVALDGVSSDGGGVFNAGMLTLVNATVADNQVLSGGTGGGLNTSGGTATLYNTLVASNTTAGQSDDLAGSLSSSSAFNVIGPANPGLGSLAYNGGPTRTIALLAGSPALAQGRAMIAGVQVPETDQRGALRGPAGTIGQSPIDVGAFELSSYYLVTSAADSTDAGTLRAGVAFANSFPSGGVTPVTIVFDTQGVFATPQTITLALGTLDLTNTGMPIAIQGPGASNVTISGNGLFGVLSVANSVTATISGVTVAEGVSSSGGAVNNVGNLTVMDATFTGNSAASGSGGGVYNTGTLTITGSTFTDDNASFYGGAIYNKGGMVTVTGSTLSGNSAPYGTGGAINNAGGTVQISSSTIAKNSAFQGGAIFATGGTVTIETTTLSGNTAYMGGGVWSDGSVMVSSSTFTGNFAFLGGAIANNFAGTLTVTNSTLAGNTAVQYGGAIDSVGVLTIISSTIAYNSVQSGGVGGGLDAYAGSSALYDTIVALNTLGTGTGAQANDIAGTVATVSSFNLIGTGGSGGLVNGTNGNQVGVAKPGLGLLASNGGPTQTITLLAGSPAIGQGSSTVPGIMVPSTDQRGVARPANSIDIGAFQTAMANPIARVSIRVPASSSGALAAAAGIPVATSVAASPGSNSADRGFLRLAPPPSLVRSSSPFHGRRLTVRRRHASGALVHRADSQTQSPTPGSHAATPAGRSELIRTYEGR